ncbi:hypothetical protein ALC56_11290, partial [Trachymyrmex septentrionalis]
WFDLSFPHKGQCTATVLTGTVVPGKACREASCRKSPGCGAPRFTAKALARSEEKSFAQCRDLLASRGFASSMPNPPPHPSCGCAYPRGNVGISGKLAGPYPEAGVLGADLAVTQPK